MYNWTETRLSTEFRKRLKGLADDENPSFGGNVNFGDFAMYSEFVAGEDLLPYTLCYLDTDGKMSKCEASTEALANTLITLSADTVAEGETGDFFLFGVVPMTGFKAGDILYASVTAGLIESHPPRAVGEIVRVVGYGLSDSKMYFNPDRTWIELGDPYANPGYKDNFANLTAAATGAGTPSLQPFGPSGTVKQRRFSIGDSVYVVWHIDHDVQPGSTCYMHVHWSSDGTDTDLVKWEINYTFAKGHQQEAFPTDSTITVEQAGQGTAWYHMIAEDATGITIPEVDSLVVAEVKRVAPSAGTNSDDVFGLFVDIHYLSDREHTPNKAPDFYG